MTKTATANRKSAERAARQELILQGALAVFREKGLEGAKIDEIARVSGFGKATLYYYFSSKEEIFSALLLNGWRSLWRELEEIARGDDSPRTLFISMLKKIVELVNTDRPLYEFLFQAPQSFTPEENERSEWKVYQNRLYKVLMELIEQCIQEGEFPEMEPRLIMRAMGGLFHGLVFLGKDRKSITENEIEEMLGSLLGKAGQTK
jgi:AcrR family transcriptional regulator